MELMWPTDFNKFRYWASRMDKQIESRELVEAGGQHIREAFGSLRTSPTIIYLLGHAMRPEDGEPIYLPAECCENWSQAATGIPFSELRDLALIDPNPRPLLLVTDFCECANLLGLPYMLCHNSAGWYWEETKAYPSSEWPDNKEVLHFAGADVNQMSYEFHTSGGIFTREFCNISPRKAMSLWERSQGIQKQMDSFFDKLQDLNKARPVQQHRVYSSHKKDLNDKHTFKSMGFY